MAEFVHIEDLHKSFQMGSNVVHALAGIDLSIKENTFTVIMGPSGSGKSTLLYLLGGLDRPTSGHLAVAGQALESMERKDRDVLVLRHFERLTNAESARELGIKESAASQRYLRALEKLRLLLSAMTDGTAGTWLR